jgi:undecaprenyl diphosphate synthase
VPEQPDALPRHIAVILDGNRRWAHRRGLPTVQGHRAGLLSFMETIDAALDLGIEQFSIYVFSTENWHRGRTEAADVLDVILSFLRDHCATLHAKGVRLCWTGHRGRIPDPLATALTDWERRTAHNRRLHLSVCADYGGRDELTHAAVRVAEDVLAGRLTVADIDEEAFGRRLYQPDFADVDLLIRTSGEQRISNFLLWQCAYAELYFTDVLWPDFGRRELIDAVQEYAARERRFGGSERAS